MKIELKITDEAGNVQLYDVSDMLPDLETVRESGQKYANEKGGSDYGFAFRCYNAGINWALNYITQKLKGNYR